MFTVRTALSVRSITLACLGTIQLVAHSVTARECLKLAQAVDFIETR